MLLFIIFYKYHCSQLPKWCITKTKNLNLKKIFFSRLEAGNFFTNFAENFPLENMPEFQSPEAQGTLRFACV